MNYILFDKESQVLKEIHFDFVYDELYYDKYHIPTKDIILEFIKSGKDKNILAYFKKYENNPEVIINTIKDDISKIDNKVPLYDEYTKNLYIVPKENVYNSVVRNSYRFPDEQLKTILKNKRDQLKPEIREIKKSHLDEKNLSEFEKSSIIHYNIIYKKASKLRSYNKLILMLNFLKQFNLSILETTYIKVFYFYSNEVGKDITVCKRPSFLPHFKHIEPYYKRSELINLALNMELVKPDNKYYDSKEVMKLCVLIKKNDIPADIILNIKKILQK
jgi:hypothetical protein